jgi:cytochrome P450
MALLTLLLPVLVVFFFLYHFHLKRRHLPPGPMPLPIVGNLLSMDPSAPHVTIANWAQVYGPIFTCWIGAKPAIMVTGYDEMKEAFVKQGDNYAARPDYFTSELVAAGKNGIINASGDKWKEQRRFSLQALREFGLGRSMM